MNKEHHKMKTQEELMKQSPLAFTLNGLNFVYQQEVAIKDRKEYDYFILGNSVTHIVNDIKDFLLSERYPIIIEVFVENDSVWNSYIKFLEVSGRLIKHISITNKNINNLYIEKIIVESPSRNIFTLKIYHGKKENLEWDDDLCIETNNLVLTNYRNIVNIEKVYSKEKNVYDTIKKLLVSL